MIALIKAFKLNFLFKLNSLFWTAILRLNGIKVGKSLYIEGSIKLKLNGIKNHSLISLGDNVSIYGSIDP